MLISLKTDQRSFLTRMIENASTAVLKTVQAVIKIFEEAEEPKLPDCTGLRTTCTEAVNEELKLIQRPRSNSI